MSTDITQTETKTDGAVKAGNGEYCFAINELEGIDAGPGYSTSKGGVIEGERMLVGYIHKPKASKTAEQSNQN